jgi:hypothetical protein
LLFSHNIPDKKLIQIKNKNNFLDLTLLDDTGRAHPVSLQTLGGPTQKKKKKKKNRATTFGCSPLIKDR